MKVVGIRPSSFKGDDGKEVSGINFYLTEPLTKGQGVSAERVYLTDQKIQDMGYMPKVGDEVFLEYNRYGKCSRISPAKSKSF